jgi:hypothetical protein
MMATEIRDQIIERVNHLSPGDQRSVLQFLEKLAERPKKGVPGSSLRPFFGTLSEEDADAMMRAIDEGCGQVDENAW